MFPLWNLVFTTLGWIFLSTHEVKHVLGWVFPWCACVGVRVFKESGNLIIKVESLIKKQIAFLCACHVGHMHIMHWRAWGFIGLLD